MQILSNTSISDGGEVLSSAKLSNVEIGPGPKLLSGSDHVLCMDSVISGPAALSSCKMLELERTAVMPEALGALEAAETIKMRDCRVLAEAACRGCRNAEITGSVFAKANRAMNGLKESTVKDCKIDACDEALTSADFVRLTSVAVSGERFGAKSTNIEVFDSVIDSDEAFAATNNVTLYNCRISGRRFGAGASNMHLVKCVIRCEDAFPECDNLVIDRSEFEPESTGCFSGSSVRVSAEGGIPGVHNPASGEIEADAIGSIVMDNPSECRIRIRRR